MSDTFIRNAWYMAAWEEEIADDELFSRKILGEPLLIYRKADKGGYVAMEDRCPHRYAPFSKGKRRGDTVICGYHGLEFDSGGVCRHNPFAELIPPNARVSSYPVEARHSIIWFWPGDAALADPDTIPDFDFLVNGPMASIRGHMTMDAHYELLTDNLMDLSHIEFVHTGSFGGGGVIFKGTHSVKEEQDGAIWSNWWMPDIGPPPWATFMPPETKLDHWLEMRWHAPATMMLEIGVVPAGSDRSQSAMPPMRGPHIITPEGDGRSHYFYTSPKFDENSEDMTGKAFHEEDKPMLEAVQRNMGNNDFWGRKPVILHVDAGSVRARRRLMKMRREEGHATADDDALTVAAE